MAAPRKVRTRCEFEFYEHTDGTVYRKCARCKTFAEHIVERGNPRICLEYARQAVAQHPPGHQPPVGDMDAGETREELIAATREENTGYDRGE